MCMAWAVIFHDEFDSEFEELPEKVQDRIYTLLGVLEQEGPDWGRPRVDTLNGSEFDNMKELRVSVGKSVWRVAFAFDLERQAILLCAGDKAGENEKRFYKRLIATADKRFKGHQASLKKEK